MSSSSKHRAGEGDWICGDSKCGNMNFARRMKCNKCGLSKNDPKLKASVIRKTGVEIGKDAAERSHGLFNADDWSCKTCGNINWARRSTCNVCHAPRFSKEEARTGLGGGYFERDGVEYVDRGNSDDEYDEFGRKKKQYRVTSKHESHSDRRRDHDRDRDRERHRDRARDGSRDRDRSRNRRSRSREDDRAKDRHREQRSSKDSHLPSRSHELEEEDEEEEDVSKYQLAEDEEDDDGDSDKYKLDSVSESEQSPKRSGDGSDRRPDHHLGSDKRKHRDSDSDSDAQRSKRKR